MKSDQRIDLLPKGKEGGERIVPNFKEEKWKLRSSKTLTEKKKGKSKAGQQSEF